MLWIIITIIFGMLILVAFDGDYEEREKKEDYKKYWEIVKGDK